MLIDGNKDRSRFLYRFRRNCFRTRRRRRIDDLRKHYPENEMKRQNLFILRNRLLLKCNEVTNPNELDLLSYYKLVNALCKP